MVEIIKERKAKTKTRKRKKKRKIKRKKKKTKTKTKTIDIEKNPCDTQKKSEGNYEKQTEFKKRKTSVGKSQGKKNLKRKERKLTQPVSLE